MEIRDIENIEPKEILYWFKQICAIPHGSYHEQAISKWVADVCTKAGCKVKVFPSGMVLAKQKASKGCEKWPVVLLQSHMDMVLAKTEKCEKDLTKDPIEPYYDTATGEIKAFETSLGGDNGVGVATQLAVIHGKGLVHGPIEHLFTVNEEDLVGRCIIEDLPVGALTAKYYINLDGEQLGVLTYGGAGCTTMKYNCDIHQINNPGKPVYNVALTGLKGGHSGVNIGRPHINPISFLAQCAYDFSSLNQIEFNILKFDGGPINNSLPTYAKMQVAMEPKQFDKFKRFCINQLIIAKKVAQGFEEEAIFEFDTATDANSKVYSFETTKKILLFASLAPNKVFTMANNSPYMYSSSNIGYMNIDDGKLKIDFKIRSFLDGEIQRVVRQISSLGNLLGFTEYIQHGQLFSFINNLSHNQLATIYGDAFKEVTGQDIRREIISGGLECAVVCVKNPSMISNTICVCSTLQNCHSPYESFSVPDTVKFWNIIKLTLSKLNN